MWRVVRNGIGLSIVGLSLIGCSDKKVVLDGQREAVLITAENIALDGLLPDVTLPDPVWNRDWPQAGGQASHAMPPLALNENLEKVWSKSVGPGSSNTRRLLSEPVVFDGVVYLLNTDGSVLAIEKESAKTLWQTSVQPDEDRGPNLGGGLSYHKDHIFVATAQAEVLCLDAKTGEIKWRKPLNSPARTAPTAKDGRVFAVTINNELEAFDTKSGDHLWTHVGIMETAGILGGASPSVESGVVVVPYSSGEVYALHAQNGHPLWSESLTSLAKTDSVSSLPHIRARPVIDRDMVYLVSHSGRMAAFDLRTGMPRWELNMGGIQSPSVAGDFLFVTTSENQVLCIHRDSGKIKWSSTLAQFENEEKSEGRIVWSGPVVAGQSLILTGSNRQAMILDAKTGNQVKEYTLSGKMYMPPVIADKTIFFLTDAGDLVAMH